MMRYTDKKGFIPKVFRFFGFFVFWLTCYLPFYPTAFADSYTQDGQPCPPECVSDSMEIITYYPSPYGYYEELRGDKIIVGDTDNSHIDETHLPPSGTITFEPKSYAQITTEGTLYEGTVYYDSFDHEFKYYDNNSSWQPLGGGGGDYWKPSEASGRSSSDIYYNWPGNVGIGVGASDTIGAKLQINSGSESKKGLVVKGFLDPKLKTNTYTYNFTSAGAMQTFTVPTNTSGMVTFSVYGAQGGSRGSCSNGGGGGSAKATFIVNPNDTFYLIVGGVGEGGSGGGSYASACNGMNGGGVSEIRYGGTGPTNTIILAGGGGGGGCDPNNPYTTNGGSGGGGNGAGKGGGGGTATSVGAGGGGSDSGSPGNSRDGGNGGYGNVSGVWTCGGGGGGDGYYGGGGGGGGSTSSGGGGGGGGSNYVSTTGTNSIMQSGINWGNGKIVIEEYVNEYYSTASSANLMEWHNYSGQILDAIDINGNLALGASSANGYKLYVNGSAYVTSGAWTASDLRFKENILPLNNSLDKILNIQPVSFDWNKIGYPDMNFEQNRQIGLVAQEVEKEIPELVRTDTNGYKSIAYDKLTVVTIEAVKEQQEEIEQLKEKLRNQQKEIELLKAEKL